MSLLLLCFDFSCLFVMSLLLPLLLLFLFTFLQLPSTQQKIYSLDQTTKFSKPLLTRNEHIKPKIKYYVTRDFKPQLRIAGHAPRESLLKKLNPRNAQTVLLDGTNHKRLRRARSAKSVPKDGMPFLTKTTQTLRVPPSAVISISKNQRTVATTSTSTYHPASAVLSDPPVSVPLSSLK